MGGAASVGENNDDLVEYLLHAGYVYRRSIELVFRAVDRAHYMLSSHQESAYKDHAWKHGNLHLSSPCIYGVAMEFLSLKPGQSFLNIGSGTGYFSTMAGLILGSHGINHGIELYEDCVQYAWQRLEEFKQHSPALEEYDFCEPLFVQGNGLSVAPIREYDSVYCGAAVSGNTLAVIKKFVKVGGVAVIPFNGRLCCFTRVDKNTWTCKKILGVSFAMLVAPNAADPTSVSLPYNSALTLQELCRCRIRQILRQNIWRENPELAKRDLGLLYWRPGTVPFFNQSYTSNESHDDDGEDHDENDFDHVHDLDEDNSDDIDEDEDEDDVDEEDEEDDDDDNDEIEADIMEQIRFLYNMEVGMNEPWPRQIQRRSVAILRRQSSIAKQQHTSARTNGVIETQSSSDPRAVQYRILEEMRETDPIAVLSRMAGSSSYSEPQRSVDSASLLQREAGTRPGDPQYMEASADDATDLSQNEPHCQGDNRVQANAERNARERDCDCDSEDELLIPWKKLFKKDNADSGIADETSSSLTADRSYPEEGDPMGDDSSGGSRQGSLPFLFPSRSDDSSSSQPSSENTSVNASTIESNLFITNMKQKIKLLPLPNTLKLYINLNRSL